MSSLAGFGSLAAPLEILQGLRAIDPAADLVHLGGAQWLLGVRRPNPEAAAEIEKQLKTLTLTRNEVVDVADRARVDQETALELQLLQYCATTGFRPIHPYTIDNGRSMHEIVQDFALRDHNWRNRPDAAFAELAEAVSIDAADAKRTAIVLAKIQADARSMFRYVIRRARSVVVQGFRRRSPSSAEASS